MAIDSRQKRFSLLHFGWLPGVSLFEADGGVDTDDRLHLLHLYSGITPSAVTPPDSTGMWYRAAGARCHARAAATPLHYTPPREGRR